MKDNSGFDGHRSSHMNNGSTTSLSSHGSQRVSTSTSDWHNLSKRSSSKMSVYEEGCLELGRDAGLGNIYHTRYHVHHKHQRHGVCSEILLDELFPCCKSKSRRSCGLMFWAISRSEAFLVTLHLTALVLGVMKEANDYRENEETLHLIHSIAETVVSLILITVRIISGYTAVHFLKKKVARLEKLEDRSKVHGTSLIRYLKFYTFGGVLLCLFLIATFFVFYYGAHLGWTVLTNQLALVLITLMASLFLGRVDHAMNQNREDHHKAVLYESVLLLQEFQSLYTHPKSTESDKREIFEKVDKFTKALRDTHLFKQPDHIELTDKYKPAQGLTFTAMMQSSV